MQATTETPVSYIRNHIVAPIIALVIALVGPFGVCAEEAPANDNPTAASTPGNPVKPTPNHPAKPTPNRPVKPTRGNRPVRPEHRHTSPISQLPDSIPVGQEVELPAMVVEDSVSVSDSGLHIIPVDSIPIVNSAQIEKTFTFNPDPTRAVWMSALCPGLGQLYNRRYWKLPIVVGAFMGLGYATSWNNTMLRDYTTAYSDIMDNDPTTKSYMDFFAPTVKEEDLDRSWLTNLLRSRKNYYRRNRDLCIICMIGVYLVAMVDAYVDAQLAHFDIAPDLSMDVAPALMNSDIRNGTSRPSIGLYWALNF
ncbi:DUF5683 domain-containing protein [uncultured Duncaniella sp.]|uniref:DUF5683 domain-containing protein n=1 Tax=uncultured Duncaniella sp. TaxID=2768039 RepID=UPI0025EC5DA1|nr:DUF5683 domain-containing protein [uncultured Duncaniella sp.]